MYMMVALIESGSNTSNKTLSEVDGSGEELSWYCQDKFKC
jgi:hypothetical protein